MYSEQTLVEELKKNSREAHDQLVARYGQMIFAMIARIVSDVRDVQELTQDTLLTSIQKIYSFNPQLSRLSTWIGKIAYNKALSFARHKEHVTIPIEDIEAENSQLSNINSQLSNIDEALSTGSEDNIAMLQQAVLTLPPDERMLLSLYYFDSMPLADIALMMDTTPQKLSKRLYNIRRKLYNRIKRR